MLLCVTQMLLTGDNINLNFMINLRYKKLQTGKFSLYFDTYSDGKRKKKFLGLFTSKDYSNSRFISSDDFETVQKANLMLSEFSSEFIPVDLEVEKQIPTLLEFTKQEFVMKDLYRSSNSSLLKHILAFSGKKKISFEEINETWANEFEEYLLSQMQESSTNSILMALKSLLNKAIKLGYIEKNSVEQKAKHFSKDRPYLTMEEFDLLQNTPTDFNPQIRLAFFFSYNSGFTLEQTAELCWEQISIQKKQSPEVWPVSISNKNANSVSKVNLEPQAVEILKQVLIMNYENRFLIQKNVSNTALTKKSGKVFKLLPNNANINIQLQLWGAIAGIEKILCFSMARNSFSMNHLNNGITTAQLRHKLGHKRNASLKVYERMKNDQTHD